MSVAATTLATVYSLQLALTTLNSLGLNNYQYPPQCTLTNLTEYDYVIVGGGSAGSVLASRLSENSNITVALIETGGYIPLESVLPGLFPLLPLSVYDQNYTSQNDNYTAQNLQDSVVSMTQGNGLGGSSILNHMIHVDGNSKDFNDWVVKSGDDSWSYDNMLEYIKKMEKLEDKEVLNSTTATYHGTSGYMRINRQSSPKNEMYLKAFNEIGCEVKLDVSGETSLGVCEPLFNIADGERQTNALAYLGPAQKRANLCVALYTRATKIIIEDAVATGVQVVDSSDETLIINAKKEVIVTAGAIGSPQLLLLSGIGPKEDLEALDIEVKADLPVGQNLADHNPAPLLIQTSTNTEASAAVNYHEFPVPTTTAYRALDSSQTYPDYQTINLLFPPDSSALVELCASVFKYNEEICDTFYAATSGRDTLFVIANMLKPYSRGTVKLASSDPTAQPIVYTGMYSNSSDLTLMGKCLADVYQILQTESFKEVNATFVDPGLCSGDPTTTEYWECYALSMSATMWHYSGTCAMGSVTDSNLKVKGISQLRVADSAAMPVLTSGNINAAITVLAEKAADLILADYSSS